MRTRLPLHPKSLCVSFICALMIGVLLYSIGNWAIPPTEKAAKQELTILSQKIATAFLLGYKAKNQARGRLTLQEELVKATQHPRVISASVRLPNNSLYGLAHRESEAPPGRILTYQKPLKNVDGSYHGIVVLELLGSDTTMASSLYHRIVIISLLGFVVGFIVVYWMLSRHSLFYQSLAGTLKQLSDGHLDVSLPVPSHRQLGPLANLFNQMIEHLRERDRMRHSLGRIMDPKIAEILIKENPKLGGLRREVVILFCDIRNYTSLCEQLSVDELQEFLNEYWKETVEIIMEQDGTIDKFHGDGVCVVFGAPNLHTDDALRAIRVAWRLVKNVEELNKKRVEDRKMPIQIGIGIHSGEVIAGNIGSERRMDYTVVGDTVNVAARIEELNKKYGTSILISDTVYEKVELYVRVKTLTLAHLRGHRKPILVHALREFLDVQDQAQSDKAA